MLPVQNNAKCQRKFRFHSFDQTEIRFLNRIYSVISIFEFEIMASTQPYSEMHTQNKITIVLYDFIYGLFCICQIKSPKKPKKGKEEKTFK